MKQCFKCLRKKPLFLFKANRMKYQIKSDMGKRVECRLCSVKRFIYQNGKIVKYNPKTKKFELITLTVNIKNIILQYI